MKKFYLNSKVLAGKAIFQGQRLDYPYRDVCISRKRVETDNFYLWEVKNEKEIASCLWCNKPLRGGRVDKKFCNEGHRNLYHNDRKLENNNSTSQITRLLKRNRKILNELFSSNRNAGSEQVYVKEDQLLNQGFVFKYHTHHLVTVTYQHEFIFCFDYGYRKTDAGKYHIIEDFEKRDSRKE